MNNSNKDWLEEELNHLGEMKAPETLLPNLMKRVEKRQARRWWYRLSSSQLQLLRSGTTGLALGILLLLIVLNPIRWIAETFFPVTRICEMLHDLAGSILFGTHIWHLPLVAYFAGVMLLGTLGFVLSVSVLQQLTLKKS